MVDNREESRMNIAEFDFDNQGSNIDTSKHVNELVVTRLEQALINSMLQDEVFQKLYTRGILQPPQKESVLVKSGKETSKRGHSSEQDDKTTQDEEGSSE